MATKLNQQSFDQRDGEYSTSSNTRYDSRVMVHPPNTYGFVEDPTLFQRLRKILLSTKEPGCSQWRGVARVLLIVTKAVVLVPAVPRTLRPLSQYLYQVTTRSSRFLRWDSPAFARWLQQLLNQNQHCRQTQPPPSSVLLKYICNVHQRITSHHLISKSRSLVKCFPECLRSPTLYAWLRSINCVSSNNGDIAAKLQRIKHIHRRCVVRVQTWRWCAMTISR